MSQPLSCTLAFICNDRKHCFVGSRSACCWHSCHSTWQQLKLLPRTHAAYAGFSISTEAQCHLQTLVGAICKATCMSFAISVYVEHIGASWCCLHWSHGKVSMAGWLHHSVMAVPICLVANVAAWSHSWSAASRPGMLSANGRKQLLPSAAFQTSDTTIILCCISSATLVSEKHAVASDSGVL